MGKFRSKLKGQSKGKRWPKGQSASSNPETTKHRDLAKSRFFQVNLGASNLTSDALKKHDAVQTFISKPSEISEPPAMDEEIESVESSSYKTMQSFASEWSHCSNMSFGRFLKVFRSDSAIHKEMLAILAAITEVIKENGGSETPTEYYCSLLTTLEQIYEVEERNESQLTAVLSLLNMGIKTVPESVLSIGFSDVTLKLLHILNDYSNSDNNIIIKSIFGILSVFLRALELTMWSNSSTTQILNTILNPFCLHTKPKWRKAAQQSVSAVVRSKCFSDDNINNNAANQVALFCEQTLETCMGGNSGTILVSTIQSGQTTILHTLTLIKDNICMFSKSHIKKCAEIILQLINLNYPVVTSCGLQVLHALFSSQKAVVPPKLNAQIISALHHYQPASKDVQPTLAWLAVMQQAYVHLADVDASLCCAALPTIFMTLIELWLSNKPEIRSAATCTLEVLLKDCIGSICSNIQLINQYETQLQKCFNAIESGLSYQYHTAWNQVLHVISVMFDVAGVNCHTLLLNCLKSLAELRDSYKFSYNNELEHAVGAAVRSMGPEIVLNVIKLKKESGELNLDRSWLLPVLRANVKNSTLDYWLKGILPLAIFCQKQANQLAEINDGIGAHSSELLYLQLWNLLPSFCNNPTDIKTNFKSTAKILGVAISDRKELRLPVMASLRKLIASAKENENNEDINELARFDKNYLPILFNVYTTRPIGSDEEGQRLAALDTIKVYLTVAKPELTKQLFTNALERLHSTPDPDELFINESVLDLIRALVPYQSSDNINILYQQCIKSLPEINNNTEQKKVYRLLEEICSSESPGCKDFVKTNRKIVQKLLMKSLNSAAVSSKGARLRCLNFLIKAQPQLDHESTLLKNVLPEAVLCCKDINERCRVVAFDLLNRIGETLQGHDEMQQFIAMLMAGLAGTPQIISATILAFASVLHNFSGALGQENIKLILENIAILTSSSTREIVVSCLSFIKVYCTSLPSPMVAASLSTIIKALTSMTEDCKRHFRLKIRDILDRLVRKYGCESITPYVPDTDVVMYKRLKNLRKLNARKKKQKEASKEEIEDVEDDEFVVHSKSKSSIEDILADSDSDFDNMETDQPKINKKKQSDAWIEENPDSIIDFTDPSTVCKITATKPDQQAPIVAAEKRKIKDRGFKTAADGRFIIEDDDSSDSNSGKRKKDFNFDSDDADSDDDRSAAETFILTDRKRKRSASSIKSSFSSGSHPPVKYKAGGVGIHRPLSVATSSVHSGFGTEYKSKKSKGDIKKKGKLDPYAYLPLQRNALNKRKKLKNAGQFKSIVRAVKKGALKGSKIKKYKK